MSILRTADLPEKLNLAGLEEDLDKRLYFDSSIPQGFGVGSSGALCAALYDRYAVDKISPDEQAAKDSILRLKKMFSGMESYFHGKSSGLDPLICYLNIPILIRSLEDLGTVDLPCRLWKAKEPFSCSTAGNQGKPNPW